MKTTVLFEHGDLAYDVECEVKLDVLTEALPGVILPSVEIVDIWEVARDGRMRSINHTDLGAVVGEAGLKEIIETAIEKAEIDRHLSSEADDRLPWEFDEP